VSIGDALAEGRRQAGLTITQVSQRTCIRETIIRGIERDDFSACGGDFYARGHIRSIAGVVGVDPEPLVEEYDTIFGEPLAISAADVFQPVTPVKLKERRRPNWTLVLALALIVVVGAFAYQHFAGGSSVTAAKAQVKTRPTAKAVAKTPAPTPPPAHKRKSHQLNISVTASQNCWVQLTSVSGQTIFSGMLYAGSSMHWTEKQAVSMVLGNPSGVQVSVNGRNPVPAGSVNVVTLNLQAGKA
jgi:cytoskeletal protein RodZ